MAKRMTCQENKGDGSPCTHPAKAIAVDGAGHEKWVCGVHSNKVEADGWSLRPFERLEPNGTGRGVSGWLMVPMRITVDTRGVGRIVEVHPDWEGARVARDDFDNEVDYEVAERMPNTDFWWHGVDEKDAAGNYTGRMERPHAGEIKRWKDIVFDDIEQFMVEESEPVGQTSCATWVPSAVTYGQPEDPS